MYPNTPSATSAHDGTVAGGSHSAPLHQGGAGDDNAHMRAFFMGRVLERRLSSRDRLAANSAAGGVQLDAAEKKAARKLVCISPCVAYIVCVSVLLLGVPRHHCQARVHYYSVGRH